MVLKFIFQKFIKLPMRIWNRIKTKVKIIKLNNNNKMKEPILNLNIANRAKKEKIIMKATTIIIIKS